MKYFVIYLIIFAPLFSIAQSNTAPSDTSYWNKGGSIGVNFNQSTLTNWAAGGSSSVSGGAYANFIFDYKKDRSTWDNTIELGYGIIKQTGEPERKTDDKIVLTSNYGKMLTATNNKWYYSAFLDFRTQFTEGVSDDDPDNYISKFMAPAYLLTSIGFDWKPKPYFSVKFGLASGKFTFVNDQKLADLGAFGVDPGSKSRAELGGTIVVKFNKEIFTNVQYTSNLILFSNYVDNPGKVDVNWENTVIMKVNSFLSVNLYNQLIYDYDVKFDVLDDAGVPTGEVEEKVQFKNILGIGLTAKFGGSRG